MSTTRVILLTCSSSRTITAAIADALRAPFRADEVWEGEAVSGDVGRDAVLADAVVGQGFGGAVVFTCYERLVADLQADARE